MTGRMKMASRSRRKPTFEDVQAAVEGIESAIEVARSMGLTMSKHAWFRTGDREFLNVSATIDGIIVNKTIHLEGDNPYGD